MNLPENECTKSIDDLPGMLALEIGIRSQQFPHSIDAQIWADEWIKTLSAYPNIAHDKGTMIGWFANAIMAGYDYANYQNRTVK